MSPLPHKTHLFIFFNLLLPIFYLYPVNLQELSLEEKVGQLLVVHFNGSQANDEAKQLIQESYVGGIIYYTWANELSSPEQVLNLSQSLQQMAKDTPHALPLFLAVDQEGGKVNRLKKGFTSFPGNYALSRTGQWEWGEQSAYATGQELKAVGINVNFAPVVDIYSHRDSFIGIRSFGTSAWEVAKWGKSALLGYRRAGIISAIKHFPGLGDAEIDSHVKLPIVTKSKEALEQTAFIPFRALSCDTDMIMTSHLYLPDLDSLHPVTFSKKIIESILRNNLKYSGLIITDSLAMQGALDSCASIAEAALKSLQAGHDLILLGGKQLLTSQYGLEFTPKDIKHIHSFLVGAIKQGLLEESRLDASVARILEMKSRYGLFDKPKKTSQSMEMHLGEHQILARQIAKKALYVALGEELLPLRLNLKETLILAPESIREDLAQTRWTTLKDKVPFLFFNDLKNLEPKIQIIKEQVKKANQTLYFCYNVRQFRILQDLLKEVHQPSTSHLVILLEDPFIQTDLNDVSLILYTFSSVEASLEAAYDYLIGVP